MMWLPDVGPEDVAKGYRSLRKWLHSLRQTHFDDFFTLIGGGVMDQVVFQLGIRPTVPLVDLLYLEYLKHLLIQNRCKRIMIYATIDLTFPKQGADEFAKFKSNAMRVFAEHQAYVEVITSALPGNSNELLSEEFLQGLHYVNSAEFTDYLRRGVQWDGNGIQDFNRHHPEDMRLVFLYSHLIRAWHIHKLVLNDERLKDARVLGLLLWESEVVQLVAVHWIRSRSSQLKVLPMLGKTLLYDSATPVPVFEPSLTLAVFDPWDVIVRRLLCKTHAELAVYVKILRTILLDNYQQDKVRRPADDGRNLYQQMVTDELQLPSKVLTRRGYEVLYLMHCVREKYGG